MTTNQTALAIELERARGLVAEHDISVALAAVDALLARQGADNFPDLRNQKHALSGGITDLRRSEIDGVQTAEHHQRTRNQLRNRLLNLIDAIEQAFAEATTGDRARQTQLAGSSGPQDALSSGAMGETGKDAEEQQSEWWEYQLPNNAVEAHKAAYVQLIAKELARLSEDIHVEIRENVVIHIGGASIASPRHLAYCLLDTTRLQDPCRILRKVHRENGDDLSEKNRVSLTNTILLVSAGTLSGDDLKYVGWMRDKRLERASARAVVGSPTKAEIVAAAIDRRSPELDGREHDADFPPGKYRIAPPPEDGPDPDNAAYASAVRHFLETDLVPGALVKDIERRLEAKVYGPTRSSDTRSHDTLVASLASRYEDNQRSYYLTPPDEIGCDAATKNRLGEISERIIRELKYVLVIALDGKSDRAVDELTAYGAVRHAIIDNTRRAKFVDG